MEWGKLEMNGNTYQIPENWLHIHYFEALTILFRLENSLRVFVYSILKNHHLENWEKQTVEFKGETKTLAEIFNQRRKQSSDFAYIGNPANSPLMYLSLGELTKIIVGNNWHLFKEYFPAKKTIIQFKLEEINTIRNSLAHFRPISIDNTSLVKTYSKQIFKEVASFLTNLTGPWKPIPTNTATDWYKDLHDMQKEATRCELTQSNDERWLRFNIIFKCGKIDAEKKKYYGSDFLNMDVHKVLENPSMQNNIIYAEESRPDYIGKSGDGVVAKALHLCFSRKHFDRIYTEELKSEIASIIKTIEEEAKKATVDKLHKGDFVHAETIYWNEDTYGWRCDNSKFQSSKSILANPVYWGRVPYCMNYMTQASSYPWMEDAISEDWLPF